ncbi:unnamed protein product, partial [Mesorhabditis belari]|uniref:Major facilitator superfamily (MFS) profile domain-containing protein n=1 Tax=Mesorhabditis belari TaxID=2138241 RepID=A0AAF3E827_9BILA
MEDSAGQVRTVRILGRTFPRETLMCRLFYLCFFASFGSLFPLLGVYFKQLGMTATQAGLLLGCRPIVELASHPFWASFASRFRKEKLLLLFSLGSLIIFTLAIGLVQPITPFCVVLMETEDGRPAPPTGNETCVSMLSPPGEVIRGGAIGMLKEVAGLGKKRREARREGGREGKPRKMKASTTTTTTAAPKAILESIIDLSSVEKSGVVGISPVYITKEEVCNYDEESYGILVTPPHSTRVYQQSHVEQAFMMLLLLIVFGEFLSSPALSLADTATLNACKDHPQEFGKIRLFGSVGWGTAMFIMGIALDYSDTFRNHPCPIKNSTEKNYVLCFVMCSVFMVAAMLVATQLKFGTESMRPDEAAGLAMDARSEEVAPAIAEKARNRQVQADATAENSLLTAIKALLNLHIIIFFILVTIFGMGTGIVFSFLYWTLQDLGGSPSLFGMLSVVNHGGEIIVYFYAFRIINKFGHMRTIYGCLLVNTVRFFILALIDNAFLAIPLQALQGLVIGVLWACASSYISLIAPAHVKSSAQQLLFLLYQGVGKGIGSILGGICIQTMGARPCFVLYGILCAIAAGAGFAINRKFKYDGIKYNAGMFDDEECDILAPQGVPSMRTDIHDAFVPQTAVSNVNYGAIDPTQDAYDRYVSSAQ